MRQVPVHNMDPMNEQNVVQLLNSLWMHLEELRMLIELILLFRLVSGLRQQPLSRLLELWMNFYYF